MTVCEQFRFCFQSSYALWCRSHVCQQLTNTKDQVASWLRLPHLRHEDPLCDENIEFMRNSLQSCSGPDGCHPFFDDGFLPTRLLDVNPHSDSGGLDARLVETADGLLSNSTSPNNTNRYAALSYCWGSAADAATQLRTTTGNLEEMKTLVPEKSMTQTLKDAVKVCKALSIPYLWVDALCIVQDSLSDWESESASMALVYKSALVTIASLASSSCRESFLDRDRKCVEVEFKSTVNPAISGTFNVVFCGPHSSNNGPILPWPDLDIDPSKLRTRGWTLQEWEASGRKLLFGKSMTHYCCISGISRSEHGLREYSGTGGHFSTIDKSHEGQTGDQDHSNIYRRWGSILQEYNGRCLTKLEDMLPALSGMAKVVAELIGDQYLAGLWKRNLFLDLLWWTDPMSQKAEHIDLPQLLQRLSSTAPYIAPSWSPLRQTEMPFLASMAESRLNGPDWKPEFVLLEGRTIVRGANPFGKILSGYLHVQSRLKALSEEQCWEDVSIWDDPCDPCALRLVEQGEVIAYVYPDWDFIGRVSMEGLRMLVISSSEPYVSSPSSGNLDTGREAYPATLVIKGDDLPQASIWPEEGDEEIYPGVIDTLPEHFQDMEETQDVQSQGSIWSEESNLEISLEVSDRVYKQLESLGFTENDPAQGKIRSEGSNKNLSLGDIDGLPEDFEDLSVEEHGVSNDCGVVTGRDAYGLLLYPAHEDGKYVRIGCWVSRASGGHGSKYFEQVGIQEVVII